MSETKELFGNHFQPVKMLTKNPLLYSTTDFINNVRFIQNLVSNYLTLSIYCAKMFL